MSRIVEVNEEVMAWIAGVMLGAAFADSSYEGVEVAAITDILQCITPDDLPQSVIHSMVLFDASTFVLDQACEVIRTDRRLAEAVASLVLAILADSARAGEDHPYVVKVLELLHISSKDFLLGDSTALALKIIDS